MHYYLLFYDTASDYLDRRPAFRGESSEVAEAFARVDPYVVNGLVTRWRVREWTTVVGEDAAVRL